MRDLQDTRGPGVIKLQNFFSFTRQSLGLPGVLGLTLVITLTLCLLLARSSSRVKAGIMAFRSPLSFQSPLPAEGLPAEDIPLATGDEGTPNNMLTNGDMDQQSFYWRYPNHWLAGSWFEWFSTKMLIPEFNDGYERGFYHTYPSSQRLQLWGARYAGGLMQSPNVTPCTYYQFQAYGQSRPGAQDPPPADVASRMKVGIEPYGWRAGQNIHDYDPALEPQQFPGTVAWSPEATHNFVFTPYSVTTEALSNTVTVIMFSNPEIDLERKLYWNDTVWDTASLVEVPPPSGTILDGPSLPEPDGLISNVSVVALPRAAIVEWDTPVPASTQVVYRIVEPPQPITGTTLLIYSVYLPLVMSSQFNLDLYSPLDSTPVLHHSATLVGLLSEYDIELAALSRRLDGQTCVTSASGITRTASLTESQAIYLPAVLREVQNE
jgi:hypothetical protein